MAPTPEPEWYTRKRRIDPKLDDAGWPRGGGGSAPSSQPHRTEDTETDHGLADYVLWLGARPVAFVEAKKVGVSAQEMLKQAERYARGLRGSPFDFAGLHVPFLYSTIGEVIWFRDVRDPRNLSRQIAAFHVPGALAEMLDRDVDAACARVLHLPHGYTAQELSVWRATLDHFDAVNIGLTATPAAHASAYFTHKVFTYSYAEAVRDCFRVDYDIVNVPSEVRLHEEGQGDLPCPSGRSTAPALGALPCAALSSVQTGSA